MKSWIYESSENREEITTCVIGYRFLYGSLSNMWTLLVYEPRRINVGTKSVSSMAVKYCYINGYGWSTWKNVITAN